MCNSETCTEPKPKRDGRALNAYRHGLTGQIIVLTPAEQAPYEHHCNGIRDSLAAEGALELDLAQAVADDRWRLKHAAMLANSTFGIGLARFDETHQHPEIDAAFVQARIWMHQGDSLTKMSLYEQRMQRRVEKNIKLIQELQKARREALQKAAEEVALLMQLAKSKGETYNIERDFPRETLPSQFVFSNTQIHLQAVHILRLTEAKKLIGGPKRPLGRVA